MAFRTIRATPQNAAAPLYPDFNNELSSFPAFPRNLDVKYTDVVARIYPLPAQMTILTQFCDNYLNHIPETEQGVVPIQFRPAAPFVLMEVVNYGKMASNIANAGWFSQHELAFGLPLEMYEFTNGQWTFVKWAMCYPFIYVDSSLSMSGGRQVYGWTKEFFQVDAQAPIFEPTGPKLLLQASIEVPSERPGETTIRPFLTVTQEQLAYSAKSIIPDVLSAIPRAITSSLEAAYGLLGASGLTQPSDNSASSSVFSMIRRFYGGVYSFLGLGGPGNSGHSSSAAGISMPPVSLITFKQFRDAVVPKNACFQAIVESVMQVDRIGDARLMSDLSAPDSSAGITLALLDDEAQPVVEMLGIQSEMKGAPDDDGMIRIKPLMPFWVQMDVSMGCAARQVWRTSWTGWTENMGVPPQKRMPERIKYIELGSGAGDELCAPFEISSPNLKMRVLPLKADWEKLNSLIQGVFTNHLDIAPADKIDGDGIVCLVLSGFAGLTADHPKGRSYNDFELTFAVPIKWRNVDVADAPYSYGLFPAYTFVGEAWNAVTNFEVYGRLTLQSSFKNPPYSWHEDLPPDLEAAKFDLSVSTKLFSASDTVPMARDLDVVGIQIHKPNTVPSKTPPTVEYLKNLGFIQTDGKIEVASIALKQVRDAIDPSRADLQTIVHLERTFIPDRTYLPDSAVAWLPELDVSLNDYTTLPIATKLGLTKHAVSSLPFSNGDGIYQLASITPFYFVGSMLAPPAIQIPRSVGANTFALPLLPGRHPANPSR